jgi:phosphate transport system substrate-binding protein
MSVSKLVASLLIAGLVATVLVAGCSRPQEQEQGVKSPGAAKSAPVAQPSSQAGQIRQVGSTTVQPLAQRWQEGFNAANKDVNIQVSGGGTGAGFKALIDGSAEIADASRAIKDEEKSQAEAKGIKPVEHHVAYDGISIVVNPQNPVQKLTLQQISDIYVGKVKTWDELGAKGLGEIQVFNRDSSSGTYDAFKEMVVQLHGKDKTRDFMAETMMVASNQAILASVAKTKTGIGYIGLGFVDQSVKTVSVVPLAGGEAVAPTPDTVLKGTYPISRKLYLYTNGEPTGTLKQYIDWIKGPEGQRIVSAQGFVPLSK